jgi:hypothetical protein
MLSKNPTADSPPILSLCESRFNPGLSACRLAAGGNAERNGRYTHRRTTQLTRGLVLAA